MSQRMEGTCRFAGKTLMVSFWARATAGTPSLGLEGVQNFGSGGTPTPNLTGLSPTSIALSTAWQRFSVSIAMPGAAGATFGTTAGTDFSVINLWLSSGATNNSRAANIGVQSCTLQLWGMQCEIGSFATPLEKLDRRAELARCQRHYLSLTQLLSASFQGAGGGFYSDFAFPVEMRAAPGVTLSGIVYNNASALAVNAVSPTHVRFQQIATALGACWAAFAAQMSADL